MVFANERQNKATKKIKAKKSATVANALVYCVCKWKINQNKAEQIKVK